MKNSIQDSGAHAGAAPGMNWYCINCGKQFATYDEAKAHWYETKDAPINDIIIQIKPGKPLKPLGTTHEGMWDDIFPLRGDAHAD